MIFSIIICTFNSADKLPKTLDSILAQAINDFEVIIVDGASKDGTVDIIKNYAEKFPEKLRWISEKDGGIYEAMNKGVKMASGNFLNIMGAGDWFEGNIFNRVGEYIESHPSVDAVYGKTRVWESDLKTNRIVQTTAEILDEYPMQHPSLFYKKYLHKKFGLYDETYKIIADYVFCLRAFYFGKVVVALLDIVVANFMMDGASSKNNFEVFKENIQVRKNFGLKTQFFRELRLYFKKLLK